MRKLIAATLALAASLPAARASPLRRTRRKDYPNRAIHIVVPFPAGGPADVAARLLAQKHERGLGPAGDRRQPRPAATP